MRRCWPEIEKASVTVDVTAGLLQWLHDWRGVVGLDCVQWCGTVCRTVIRTHSSARVHLYMMNCDWRGQSREWRSVLRAFIVRLCRSINVVESSRGGSVNGDRPLHWPARHLGLWFVTSTTAKCLILIRIRKFSQQLHNRRDYVDMLRTILLF